MLSGRQRASGIQALFLVLLASDMVIGATPGEVEAEWQRHDESRLAEIREPGTVRFPEFELAWPGTSADTGLGVPPAPRPSIDGRLDELSWKQAADLPAEAGFTCRIAHHPGELSIGIKLPTALEGSFTGVPTAADAAGAVDGVKNGRYGFHAGLEPNPWWQVDLGRSQPLSKVIVYNRLDYQPGLHNADHLLILTSDDGRQWTRLYDNAGKHFGGVGQGEPLTVDLAAGSAEPVQARFVRLQIKSQQPIFFHLDEVEIYGSANPETNIALHRPAQQSSLSPWSRGLGGSGTLCSLDAVQISFDPASPAGLAIGGLAAPAEFALARSEGQTCLELVLPREAFAEGFPKSLTLASGNAVPLRAAGDWQLSWPEGGQPRFGRNRIELELAAAGRLDPPVTIRVETVVFTQLRPERKTVFEQALTAPGAIPLEFAIDQEGAAAVIVKASQGPIVQQEVRSGFIPPVVETLNRVERLAEAYQLAPPGELAALRAAAAELVQREQAGQSAADQRAELCRRARWLNRRMALSSPILDCNRLLVVKRFTQQTYPDVCLNHMPWCSRPGGDICVLTLGGPDEPCQVQPVLDGMLGPGHVRGMDLWWDGDRVVFGYAQSPTMEPPPGWLDRRTSFELRRTVEPIHIFEVQLDGKGLRQLTDGPWSDLDPTYLPNGDVAFASERCGFSLQCNELDKDETSCNLYVMRGDGSNVRRLSVTKDGDYLPHTLDNGSIGYTRWEYEQRGWAHIQSIWTIRPDGTFADALFKQHFNDPWAIEDARSIPSSTKMVAVATGHHTLAAGPVIVVDPREGMNDPAGIRIVTPGVVPPEGGMSGLAVHEGGVRGKGGHYMNPWPLSETTFLAAYTYGPQNDETGYAIYLIDVFGTKELIYRDPSISCVIPIPLRPRMRPPILPDLTDGNTPAATCMVSNVTRGVDGIDSRAARYLRISQGVAWPYTIEEGGERYEPDVKPVMINWNPTRVIGTVPIEADGSAHFVVPADEAVYFQLLDENHMELRRMRSFISFQPGEVRGCFGCHESREEAPGDTKFPLAMARDPSVPQPPPWGSRPISFLRDVQPVFDKHCTGCHDGLQPAAGLDFSGGLTARHNRAYDTILEHNLVARSNVGDDARITAPLAFGSHKSRLVEVLRSGPCGPRVKLSGDDWLRLVTWIDANAPYHDGFINKRALPAPYDLPGDRQLFEKLSAIHARRCSACHDQAAITRSDWIDLRDPEKSRFLAAPLSRSSGGTGICSGSVYADANDADYRAASELVATAVERAWQHPRRDVKSLLSAESTQAKRPLSAAPQTPRTE